MQTEKKSFKKVPVFLEGLSFDNKEEDGLIIYSKSFYKGKETLIFKDNKLVSFSIDGFDSKDDRYFKEEYDNERKMLISIMNVMLSEFDDKISSSCLDKLNDYKESFLYC